MSAPPVASDSRRRDRRRNLVSLASVLVAAACGRPSEDVPTNAPSAGRAKLSVTDVAPSSFRCEVRGTELIVEVEVPSGGWAFEHVATAADEFVVTADFRLTRPAPSSAVAARPEIHTARTPVFARHRAVHVRVARWVHGVDNPEPPAFELVRVVDS